MMKTGKSETEKGTIMLEGVFAITITIIVLAFLLSFGFYLYEKTVVRIVTDQVAEEVAQTYKYRSVKDASSLSLDDITGKGRFRYILHNSKFLSQNKTKGTNIAKARLPLTALAKEVSAPTVSVKQIGDDLGRSHFEVTVSVKYQFMLGGILRFIGIGDVETITETAIVENVDVSDYVNTVKWVKYGIGKVEDNTVLIKCINSVVGLVSSFYSLGH